MLHSRLTSDMLEHLLLLFRTTDFLLPNQIRSTLGILKFHDIQTLFDLRMDSESSKIMESFHYSSQISRHGDDLGIIWLLDKIHALATPMEGLLIQDSNGWSWSLGNKLVQSWNLPNTS